MSEKDSIIANLRSAREGGRRPSAPDADLWDADLRGADLWGANLWGTDLRGANLWGANLWGTDLRGANLWGTDLRGANLWGTDLRGADLWDADLRDADLRGVSEILQITGMPSGQLILAPTCEGWQLVVGCWGGDLDGFKALISQAEGWPEAKGNEVVRRRPSLLAAIAMCEAHIALHPGLVEQLAEKWGSKAESEAR